MASDTLPEFGQYLYGLRREAGTPRKPLPQAAAAERCGLSRGQWNRLERPGPYRGRDEVLRRIAGGFGRALDEVFAAAGRALPVVVSPVSMPELAESLRSMQLEIEGPSSRALAELKASIDSMAVNLDRLASAIESGVA